MIKNPLEVAKKKLIERILRLSAEGNKFSDALLSYCIKNKQEK